MITKLKRIAYVVTATIGLICMGASPASADPRPSMPRVGTQCYLVDGPLGPVFRCYQVVKG